MLELMQLATGFPHKWLIICPLTAFHHSAKGRNGGGVGLFKNWTTGETREGSGNRSLLRYLYFIISLPKILV